MLQAAMLFCVLAAWLAPPSPDPPLALGTREDRFTVNGEPRFLVLVSYFDALDASALDEDLDYIRGGADGVRVLANWWDWDGREPCRLRFSERTLMAVGDDGRVSLRRERLERLETVLRAARARGLVVDLTFSYETVRGLSRLEPDGEGRVCGSSSDFANQVRIEEYERGLVATARALASPEFSHVFFDLQNEVGGGWTRLSADELRRLAGAVRTADPKRLLSVSAFEPSPERQVALVKHAGLDLLNFHDFPRDSQWPDRTGPLARGFVEALQAAGLRRPVYAGEPPPEAGDRGEEAFRTSLAGARKAGAAAWTFHTRSGFRLDEGPFAGRLDAAGRAFLDGRRSAAAARRTGREQATRRRVLGVD